LSSKRTVSVGYVPFETLASSRMESPRRTFVALVPQFRMDGGTVVVVLVVVVVVVLVVVVVEDDVVVVVVETVKLAPLAAFRFPCVSLTKHLSV
jgi:hypothetical protein